MFCVDDSSPYCESRSCHAALSRGSAKCNKPEPPGKIIRLDWVVSWKQLNLDGQTRPVSG